MRSWRRVDRCSEDSVPANGVLRHAGILLPEPQSMVVALLKPTSQKRDVGHPDLLLSQIWATRPDPLRYTSKLIGQIFGQTRVMKTAFALLLFLLFLCSVAFAADKAINTTVRAISHSVRVGYSNGSWASCQNNANIVNCQGGGGFEKVEVTEVAELDDQRYTLLCSGVPFRSVVYQYCEWLHFDGDSFKAEIKGKKMTIYAHSGGNQGKEIKLKFQILDIRPVEKLN
jgi:hypothetical protein